MGGFLFFFYMFFALATSIYRDYRLEAQMSEFESEINKLAVLANQKPSDLKYLQSPEYKDKYAKESLNLLNFGEELIILPKNDQHVEQGPVELMTDALSPNSVLNMSNPRQWWEYFFGQTLTVKPQDVEPLQEDLPEEPEKEDEPAEAEG